MTQSKSKKIFAFILMAILSGCAGERAVPTYDLSALAASPSAKPPQSSALLIVTEPVALQMLDTDRIVLRPASGQIGYLAEAQWADRLPKLLQTRLIQSLENAHMLKGIGRPGDRLTPDYQLVSELRAFHISGQTAEVEISAKLVSERTGRIIAAQIFRAETEVNSLRGPAVITALDEASTQIFEKMISWIRGKL